MKSGFSTSHGHFLWSSVHYHCILLISDTYKVKRCGKPVVHLFVPHAGGLIHELRSKRLNKYFLALLQYFFILFQRAPTKSSMLMKMSTPKFMWNVFIFYLGLSPRKLTNFLNNMAFCVGFECCVGVCVGVACRTDF